MVKHYYHYIITQTEPGYEIHNTKNGEDYFVSHTEQLGWNCTCPAKWKGNNPDCKHRIYVRRLFKLDKK